MNSLFGNIFKGKSTKTEEDRIIDLLKGIPLFDGLTSRELSAVERILHRRTYRSEETIFRQGEPGVGMYIIIEGRVAVVAEPGSRTLAQLQTGEFFGELALLDDSPRSASAIAQEECRMLGFFQPDLFGLIDRNPHLGVKIVMRLARVIGERLKKCNEQLESRSVGRVEGA
ncbi:MAG TPA: cyclic nucleotide-binding domain-containing protein [Bacteroidetes bacterium]|jgi:CRP/FNR family transcriptional regulator, cyclic AMP receptor protein|nr:cyclic nucleotide-binding domain-containing protein [Bacteroidota bacterium]